MMAAANFPKAQLEALAEYWENVADTWLAMSDGSPSATALQAETRANVSMIRQAITAHANTEEQLRLLGEGLRPGAVIAAPEEIEERFPHWVHPREDDEAEANGLPD